MNEIQQLNNSPPAILRSQSNAAPFSFYNYNTTSLVSTCTIWTQAKPGQARPGRFIILSGLYQEVL